MTPRADNRANGRGRYFFAPDGKKKNMNKKQLMLKGELARMVCGIATLRGSYAHGNSTSRRVTSLR